FHRGQATATAHRRQTTAGGHAASAHTAGATTAHHAFHAAHHVLHATFGAHLLHHLRHHFLLLHQAIELLDLQAGAIANTFFARPLDQLRITALLRGHGIDQRLHVLHLLHRHRVLGGLHHAAHAGQFVEQAGQTTHVPHLLELVLEILEVHG